MTFGEYLRKTRTLNGLTAQELGDRIGTTGQYITQTEQGKLKAPNRQMAHRLAEALDVSLVEMWGIAALERRDEWCRKEGIDAENSHIFFQAALFDRKKAAQRLSKA